MTELLTIAIGAIGALLGLVGLITVCGGLFLVFLFFKKLPVGLRTAISAAATYCVAATVMRTYALQAMDLIMLRSMLNAYCLFGLSGLCLSIFGTLPLADGVARGVFRRNSIAGSRETREAKNAVLPDRKNKFSVPCDFCKVSAVMLS